MSNPRRLLDDATGIERTVLDSARLDDPSPERRRRMIAAGTTVAAGAVSMSSSASAALAWKVVIGLAGVGAVSVGYRRATVDPVVVAFEAAPAVIPRAKVALPAISTPPAVVVTGVPSASIAPSATASTSVSAAKAVASAGVGAPISIAREIALVDEARAAIHAGDAARARAALDRYDAECAGGTLSIEAQVLRIEATALDGDEAGAAKFARQFLERHPSSPLATRVRKFIPGP